LLNPFSVACGLMSVLLFLQHGAIYLALKSEGPQQERSRKLATVFYMLGVVLYVLLTVVAMLGYEHLFRTSLGKPLFWLFLVLVLASAAALPVFVFSRRFASALVASSGMIAGMMALAANSLFPRLVPSTVAIASNSLTISNSSSTQYTLGAMLTIAVIGVPIVLIYTICIYRVFKGKVVVSPEGY
jgi:cytochrome d ubiquinol oxidase subunit II